MAALAATTVLLTMIAVRHSREMNKKLKAAPTLLDSYCDLPPVRPITPKRATQFLADELCEEFPRTGVLPGEDWMEFSIVSIWDIGPIGLEGRAFRHPSEALIRVKLTAGESLFLLPARGNGQLEAIGRHLRSGAFISKERHKGWTLRSRPKRDTYRIMCSKNLKLILSLEVFDPLKECPTIHVRATLIDA